MEEKFSVSDVERFYIFLGHKEGEWTELRAIEWIPSTSRERTGEVERTFVDNKADFVMFCRRWNGRRNIYAGVNPRRRKGGSSEDVARVSVVPFDVDSDHPKDEPAADMELREARDRKLKPLLDWLRKHRYKTPFLAMSGNGYHVLQKVDIPIPEGMRETVAEKLQAYFRETPLSGKADSIFDLPRVIKVPGTLSVKGKPSLERPHRVSKIITSGSMEPDEKLAEHILSLQPQKTVEKKLPAVTMAGSFRNQYGWSIEEIRARDGKLDELLSTLNPAGYKSPSEADMAAVSKLLFWGYTAGEAVQVLRHFRGRSKLNREDYVKTTLSKVSRGETIANYVDPSRWNPSTGYELAFEAEKQEFDVEGKIGLVFNIVSKRNVKVKAVKEGKAVTGWVTVDSPEKLRTSRNAKILREVLKAEHPADWRILLENAVERIQKAVASFKPEAEKPSCEREESKVEPEVEEEVERILNSDDPLSEIKRHLDNLIAGEDANKLTIFLLLLSGKCPNPSLKQMILLKGEAGAGKSTLMSIADLFKTKSVGRFTEHALDYTELEGFEVLKLKEIGVMDEEKQGVSTLKFLSSDDEGYIVEFTIRDPETGEFTTQTKRIPAITVISSTTRLKIDPQYQRRNWIISPDESREQTLRIKKWFVKHEREKAEVILGFRKETSYDWSRRVLKELVRRIEPCSVIIPFEDSLLDVLNHGVLRVRGDYKKISSLVNLYGVLLQRKLPKLPAANSHAFLMTAERSLEALNVALEPLVNMTADLEKRTAIVLRIMEDLGYKEKGAAIDKSAREEIAVRGGWAESTVRQYLNQIEAAGYLSSDGKRPKTWYLLYSMDAIRRKMSVVSLKIENYDILVGNMRKEAQEWLKTLSLKKSETDTKYISQAAQPFSLREIISPSTPTKIHNSVLDENKASSEENGKNHRKSVKFTINQGSPIYGDDVFSGGNKASFGERTANNRKLSKFTMNHASFRNVSQLRNRVIELVKQGEAEKDAARKVEVLDILEKEGFDRRETLAMIGQLVKEGVLYEPKIEWLKTTFDGPTEKKVKGITYTCPECRFTVQIYQPQARNLCPRCFEEGKEVDMEVEEFV